MYYNYNTSVRFVNHKIWGYNFGIIANRGDIVKGKEGTSLVPQFLVSIVAFYFYIYYNGVGTKNIIKDVYINAGYYDKIVEYDTGNIDSLFVLGDYDNQNVTCTEVVTSRSIETHAIFPAHVYSEMELATLNQD